MLHNLGKCPRELISRNICKIFEAVFCRHVMFICARYSILFANENFSLLWMKWGNHRRPLLSREILRNSLWATKKLWVNFTLRNENCDYSYAFTLRYWIGTILMLCTPVLFDHRTLWGIHWGQSFDSFEINQFESGSSEKTSSNTARESKCEMTLRVSWKLNQD